MDSLSSFKTNVDTAAWCAVGDHSNATRCALYCEALERYSNTFHPVDLERLEALVNGCTDPQGVDVGPKPFMHSLIERYFLEGRSDYLNLLQLWLERGADPGCVDHRGEPALLFALRSPIPSRALQVVECICNSTEDVRSLAKVKDSQGKSLFQRLVELHIKEESTDYLRIASILINLGFDATDASQTDDTKMRELLGRAVSQTPEAEGEGAAPLSNPSYLQRITTYIPPRMLARITLFVVAVLYACVSIACYLYHVNAIAVCLSGQASAFILYVLLIDSLRKRAMDAEEARYILHTPLVSPLKVRAEQIHEYLRDEKTERLNRYLDAPDALVNLSPTALLLEGLRSLKGVTPSAVQALLARGADLNYVDEFGHTPLQYTVLVQSPQAALTLVRDVLLKHESTRATTCATLLPLVFDQYSLRRRFEYWDLLDLLLKSGADPTQADSFGTPLIHALIKEYGKTEGANYLTLLQSLFEKKEHLTCRNQYGQSALLFALQSVAPAQALALIERMVSSTDSKKLLPQVEDSMGNTLLHALVEMHNKNPHDAYLKLVPLLVEAGHNVLKRGFFDQMPVDLAEEEKMRALLDLEAFQGQASHLYTLDAKGRSLLEMLVVAYSVTAHSRYKNLFREYLMKDAHPIMKDLASNTLESFLS